MSRNALIFWTFASFGVLVLAGCQSVSQGVARAKYAPAAIPSGPVGVAQVAILKTSPSEKHREFLEAALPVATELWYAHGVPPSATLAQSIYESGYGSSTLAREAHNFFGLKATSDWHGERLTTRTKDRGRWHQAEFKKFSDLEEGFHGYAEHLRTYSRYKRAWHQPTGVEFVRALLRAGYCPDRRYLSDIRRIMARHQLRDLDVAVRKTPKQGRPVLTATSSALEHQVH